MSYKHKCEYCGEVVTYAGIWEAELHWNHECLGLKKEEDRIDSLGVIAQWRKKEE